MIVSTKSSANPTSCETKMTAPGKASIASWRASFDNLSSEAGLGAAITKIAATFMSLSTLVTNAFKMIKT